MKHIFLAKVKDGGLKVSRRSDFVEVLNSFEGKDIQITIDKKKNDRSILQNNYYWAVCVPLVREGLKDAGMKMSKEETHELLKYKFLQVEKVNEETGEVFKFLGSSAELTTTGFMEYIADIQQWGAEYLDIQIPSPNEQISIEL